MFFQNPPATEDRESCRAEEEGRVAHDTRCREGEKHDERTARLESSVNTRSAEGDGLPFLRNDMTCTTTRDGDSMNESTLVDGAQISVQYDCSINRKECSSGAVQQKRNEWM